MSGRRRTSVLVGRRADLDALDEALATVRSGTGRVVVISGDAGIGKSRLIEEFVSRNDDALVVTGHCVDGSTDALAYAPWSELLWWLMRSVDTELVGDERDRLARLLPEIHITEGEAAEGGKDLLFEAVIEVLNRVAQTRPVVVVIEDIHWIDAASRDVLLSVSRNIRRLPLLVVATHRNIRSPELEGIIGALQREDATTIALEALDDAAAGDVAAQLIGVDPDEPEVLSIVGRADGNPLFVEELVAARGEDQLPDTIRHLLLSRFTTLGEDARHFVRTGAVIGARIPRAWLADAAGLAKETTKAAARDAIDSGVLVAAPDRRGYLFAHSLIRDAVLDDVLPDELVDLHEAVAQALENNPGIDDDIDTVAELARHWDAAERPAQALKWTIAAAEQADRRYAFDAAAHLFERALRWWKSVPDASAEVGRTHADLLFDAADAAGAAGHLGEAARLAREGVAASSGTAEVVEAVVRASIHYWAVGQSDRLQAIAERFIPHTEELDDVLRAKFLLEVGESTYFAGRIEDALRLSADVVIAAERAADVALQVRAHQFVARCYEEAADVQGADEEFEHAERLARQHGMHSLRALVCYNRASFFSTYARRRECLEKLDEVDELVASHGVNRLRIASRALRADELTLAGDLVEAARVVEAIDHEPLVGVDHLAFTLSRSLLDLCRGEYESVLATLDSEDANAEGVGPTRVISHLYPRAEAMAWQGRSEDAARLVDETLKVLDDGFDLYYGGLLAMVGVRARADQLSARNRSSDVDLVAYERAQAVSTSWRLQYDRLHSVQPLYDAFTFGVEAELQRAMGSDFSAAARRAADAFDGVQVPYYVAYFEWREAQALLRARDRRSPIPALTSARRRAIHHGFGGIERAVDQTARAEQIRLGARSDSSDELLSAREVEVLRLLSDGRSNPEIADELVIGRRTVRTHVSNILQKLGASSRGEAVAIAHRRDMI